MTFTSLLHSLSSFLVFITNCYSIAFSLFDFVQFPWLYRRVQTLIRQPWRTVALGGLIFFLCFKLA